MGYRYPELLAGLHRLRGVPATSAPTSCSRCSASTSRVLDGGRRHDRDRDRHATACSWRARKRWRSAAIAAGCRFFAGYPMTPFTEVLEHFAKLPPRRGRRVHQRRVGARSGRHGVGRARRPAPAPRPARPARASRSCRSRSRRSRSPSCRSSSSTWRAASRTTTRRPAAAVTATTATSCSRRRTSTEGVELVQLAFHLADKWRNPVLVYGDYLLAHTQEAVVDRADRVPRAARRRTGRSTARAPAAARAAASRRSASPRPARPRWARRARRSTSPRRSR